MCGIAGILTINKEINKSSIEKMSRAISRRGPDGEGFYLENNKDVGVALAHRRLAIVEGSQNQPISNEDESLWLVCNGEIYNHKELREKLVKKGHQFSTRLDLEVILHLYEKEKENCVSYLKGMFAFAIWDKKNKTLFLARDRMGIKPLYYAWLDRRNLVFASEAKAILTQPIQREINGKYLLEQTILGGYVISQQDETIFKGIKQLSPGSTLLFYPDFTKQNFIIKENNYFKKEKEEIKKYSGSFQEAASLLKERMEDTVKLFYSHSALPKAIALSGGLDSSFLAVLLKTQNQNQPILTFFISDGSNYSDLVWSRRVAKAIGSFHREIIVSFEDTLKNLVQSFYIGECFAPYAFRFIFLTKEIKNHAKIIFLGDGSDDLFCGYPEWFLSSHGEIEKIKTRLNFFSRYSDFESWISDFKSALDIDKLKTFKNKSEKVYQICLERLNNWYLSIAEKVSLNYQLESQYPYLYEDILGFSLSLPIEFKMNEDSRYGKKILKNIAAPYFKNLHLIDLVHRKKSGFQRSFYGSVIKLDGLANQLISDDYFYKHPYQCYFLGVGAKRTMLLFDLFYFMFIDNSKLEPHLRPFQKFLEDCG